MDYTTAIATMVANPHLLYICIKRIENEMYGMNDDGSIVGCSPFQLYCHVYDNKIVIYRKILNYLTLTQFVEDNEQDTYMVIPSYVLDFDTKAFPTLRFNKNCNDDFVFEPCNSYKHMLLTYFKKIYKRNPKAICREFEIDFNTLATPDLLSDAYRVYKLLNNQQTDDLYHMMIAKTYLRDDDTNVEQQVASQPVAEPVIDYPALIREKTEQLIQMKLIEVYKLVNDSLSQGLPSTVIECDQSNQKLMVNVMHRFNKELPTHHMEWRWSDSGKSAHFTITLK